MKKYFLFCALIIALVLTSCSPEFKLEFQVGVASADCPVDIGDGVTITNIDTEGNNVVYTCVVDESDGETSVADFDDPFVRSVMKEASLEYIKTDSDPDTRELIRLIKDANYNIVYRYVGSHTNAKVNIIIYPHEL